MNANSNLQQFEQMAMMQMPATIQHNGGKYAKTGKYDRHYTKLPMAQYTNGKNIVWVSIVGKILETQ